GWGRRGAGDGAGLVRAHTARAIGSYVHRHGAGGRARRRRRIGASRPICPPCGGPGADAMNAVQRIFIAGAAACLAGTGSAAQAQTVEFLSGMPGHGVVRDAPFSAEGITAVTQTLANGTRIQRPTKTKFYG